ncbi:ABC transporter substrate-binding protein [Aidingimonas halophila]|uniref:Putative hydroxymethylpyrimidine transport system substrate-binding protein n=1 Tax=Aidingimonas halophila TaxID=574349 RepID=A0A1H3BJ00_9GAMM|nr:ABC transporter substrate-binding protein [Aidingimonas halophila]GHC26489.1 hypothetical protein GCM10008094_17290 [Aidingimonas halophila]SDX41059.1 putative hydroxymethylpyrimidine transport system substrate-binding protein [Aidingimonas halophila]
MTLLTRRSGLPCLKRFFMLFVFLILIQPAIAQDTSSQEEDTAENTTNSLPLLVPLVDVDAALSILSESAQNTEEDTPSVTLRDPEPIAPPPLQQIRIMLDWYPSPQHAALLVAEERGYFDREGLDVKLISPADASVPAKLLAASRVDLALSRQPELHRLVDDGAPVVRIGTLIATPLASVLVRSDSEIESISELAGKTVGYSMEDNLDPILDTMLGHHGLHLNDIDPENVNFSLQQSLATEEVDAIVGNARHTVPYQLNQEGIPTRQFLAEEYGVPRHDGLILMANRDRLESQRGNFQRLLVAIEEATLWMVNHPDEAWELMVAKEPGLDSEANQNAWPETLRRMALRPSALNARRYRHFEQFLHERNNSREKHPVGRLAVDLNS